MPRHAELHSRQPYPLSWDEQRLLLAALPKRLAHMALFKVNTGCREQKVCGLRWRWGQHLPDLGASVFVIAGAFVKNGQPRVVVLNDVSRAVIEEYRGQHPEFVFHHRGSGLKSMNNT